MYRKIRPQILEQFEDGSKDLYVEKLSFADIIGIAEALKTNTTLRSINLQGVNQLSTCSNPVGCSASLVLSSLLRNTRIVSLETKGLVVSPADIAKLLEDNSTILKIDIDDSGEWKDEYSKGVDELLQLVPGNTNLVHLRFDNFRMRYIDLASILLNNATLTTLRVKIAPKGGFVEELIGPLKCNTSITSLCISLVGVELEHDQKVDVLEDVLVSNERLTNIEGNLIWSHASLKTQININNALKKRRFEKLTLVSLLIHLAFREDIYEIKDVEKGMCTYIDGVI